VAEEAVDQIRPLCFLRDAKAHLYNFVMELRTPLPMIEILRLHSTLACPEHPELTLVPPEQLKTFISNQPPTFAELTRTILSHGGFGEWI
jgi:hypothetical protein